jgi:hypothetical protein
MRSPAWVTATDIDDWAKTTGARYLLPDLIRRLVLASIERENLQSINFPAYEEAHRPGYDGVTLTNVPHTHVPEGMCVWELSCDGDPKGKAEEDYKKRLQNPENQDLSQLTYFAITARDWNGAASWATKKNKEGKFKEVRAYDSNNLVQWMLDTPAVGFWFAEQIGKEVRGAVDVDTYWRNLLGTLKRELSPEILLTNRQGTAKALAQWVEGNPGVLIIRAPSPREMVDVFVAWVHTITPEEADSIASRSIIVDDSETWKVLATSKQRLILIAGPRLEALPDLLSEAKRQGHHLLRFASFTEPKDPAIVEMETMRVYDLKEALQNAGIEDRAAAQLAEGAGGSFTVFRRQFAGDVGMARPEWANGVLAQELSPLLLAAAWNQSNANDCQVLEKLTGKRYPEIEKLAKLLLAVEDPPLRQVFQTWEFVSPQDAWTLLHKSLTSSQIDAFESVIIDVLGEKDPVLNLPAKDRFMASAQGTRHRFSDSLRRGLAEILALSAGLACESVIVDEHDFIGRARRIVSQLLSPGSDWKRWASLGALSPFLAEAAPEQFLEAVSRDLKSSNPALVELMRQEHDEAVTGAIYHSGFLWAMEALAWSTKYTATVANLLARLAELDPGGKWANRPKASLQNLFFSWRPQTMATIDQLLAILRRLTQKHPEAAWNLLIGLLPERQGAMIDSYKPSPWRSWAAGWMGEILVTDYWRYVSGVVELALNLVAADAGRWLELLDHCTALLPVDRARIFEALEKTDPGSLNDDQRVSLWKSLRETVQKHTAFHDADWALPAEEVNRLAEIRDRFAPQDAIQIAEPLFDEGQMIYESTELPYEERLTGLRQRQQIAVERIWNIEGLSGVLALAEKVKDSWRVGLALAEAKGGEPDTQIIPELLCSANNRIVSFAAGYAGSRIDTEGPDWAERLPTTQWAPEQIAAFACLMRFNSRTWDWVENSAPEVKRYYWTKVSVWSVPPEPTQLEAAARKLIESSRPSSAVTLLAMGMYNKLSVSSALLFDVLEALLSAGSEEWQAMETFYVQQFIKRLQAEDQVDETRLGKLEFGFLPILSKHTVRASTLERLLARDPKFFVDCLKLLYRPRHEVEEKEPKERDAQDAQRATLLWRLLNEWRHIPGTQPDGSISASELNNWVTAARTAARAVDRLEVCDIKIGEVLAHAPSDEDGVKPCIPVREIIEDCASDEIDRGFTIGLYNLRGHHWKNLHEGGQQERDLADTYERYARACETEWPRTAAALRSLAQSYLREAEAEDADARMRK